MNATKSHTLADKTFGHVFTTAGDNDRCFLINKLQIKEGPEIRGGESSFKLGADNTFDIDTIQRYCQLEDIISDCFVCTFVRNEIN